MSNIPEVKELVDDGTVVGERDGFIKTCLCSEPEEGGNPYKARIMGSAWLEWSDEMAPNAVWHKGSRFGFWLGMGGTYLYIKGYTQ